MKTMLFSMTGFVSKTIQLPVTATNASTYLTFSIKSLNSRFFEATCRLPQTLSSLEIELTARARAQLKRGNLSITINVSDPNYFKGPIQPSLSTIENYLTALKAAQKNFNLPGEISVETLLELPNIFIAEENALAEDTKQKILNGFDDAISELKGVRAAEGAQLLNDLNERITQLKKFIHIIEQAFKETFSKRQHDINQHLAELQTETGEVVQQQRMQLYLELDRIDIHEEITRFNTHLQTLTTTIEAEQEEKGRHLDFILQELGREINTMSAKCANSEISSHAVSIKVELEKFREQIQNIV